MADYKAEVDRVLEGDGIVRDFPIGIERKFNLSSVLLAAGRRLAEETLEEAIAFLDAAAPVLDDEDPFEHTSAYVSGRFGRFYDLSNLVHVVPQHAQLGMHDYEMPVAEFVQTLLSDGQKD